MKAILSPVVVWFGVLFSAHAANATADFIFETEDAAVVPVEMELREVATRTWVPGCMLPDVLQHSGWFPATFRYQATPERVATNRYAVNIRRGFFKQMWARICGAQMDSVNYVGVEKTNDAGDAPARASFAIDPTGNEREDVTFCPHNDELSPRCTQPRVDARRQKRVTIRIVWTA